MTPVEQAAKFLAVKLYGVRKGSKDHQQATTRVMQDYRSKEIYKHALRYGFKGNLTVVQGGRLW